MKKVTQKEILIIFIGFTLTLSACGQSFKDRTTLGEIYAKEELKNALLDTTGHEVLVKPIIPDKETAINISEPILFKAYGKENIISQRPYETYFIDNHWIIIGTLPSGYDGGTFLIIINAKDGKVIRLTHGK